MTQRGFLGLRKTEETILIESHQVLSKLRDFSRFRRHALLHIYTEIVAEYHLPHRRFSIVLDFVPSVGNKYICYRCEKLIKVNT